MPINFLVGGVLLGVLPLAARTRAAIAAAIVGLTSLALLTAYIRFTDPSHAASLPGADAVILALWWRSCPLLLFGLAASPPLRLCSSPMRFGFFALPSPRARPDGSSSAA